MAVKIYLYDNDYDCIGSGNLSSAYVQYQLEAAGGQDVEVHISSVGGSAFDAITTYDLLKKYPGKVTTHIDALAASAASIIAMAGQQVFMSKYALLMIHKPMVGSGGNADELMKDVEMLNVVQTRLAAIYMDKTGLDEDTINELINAVTWMTSDQALDLGFIDQVEDYAEETEKVSNSALIRKYSKTAPAIYQRCINKILLPENQIIPKNNDMNPENKELIEKNISVLDKILNFFKKSVNKKTVTNSATFHHTGPLNEGTEVFNDEDMEDSVQDGDYEVDDKVITIKDGKVSAINNKESDDPDKDNDDDSNPDGDDDDDEDIDPDNKVILNTAGIKFGKKIGNKVFKNEVVKNFGSAMAELTKTRAQFDEQSKLLSEAQNALKDANDKLEKTREEIKKEIKSSFQPPSSQRSNRMGVEDKEPAVPEGLMPKEGSVAYAAVKNAVAKQKSISKKV